MKQNARAVLNQEHGDFASRCMPRTCALFVETHGGKTSQVQKEDPFDFFLQQRVAFLSYMIRAYYELGKPPELQLVKFGSQRMLDSLDKLLFLFFRMRKEDSYAQAREMYIFMLERYLIDSVLERYRSLNRHPPVRFVTSEEQMDEAGV